MRKNEKDLIIRALDALALALTDYNHEWSEEQNRLYEQAVAILERESKATGDEN